MPAPSCWALVVQSSVVAAVVLSAAAPARAYCNSMGGAPFNYGPRTSKAFPPGWNGLAKTPVRGWRSWYAYYTHMDQGMIKEAVDALVAKNRTVAGWDGKVSLCDLGTLTTCRPAHVHRGRGRVRGREGGEGEVCVHVSSTFTTTSASTNARVGSVGWVRGSALHRSARRSLARGVVLTLPTLLLPRRAPHRRRRRPRATSEHAAMQATAWLASTKDGKAAGKVGACSARATARAASRAASRAVSCAGTLTPVCPPWP